MLTNNFMPSILFRHPCIHGLWVADGSLQTSMYHFAHHGTRAYFLA